MVTRKNSSHKVVENSNTSPTPSATAPADPFVTVAPTRESQSYVAAQVNATILGWQQSLGLLATLADADQQLMAKRVYPITPAVIEAIATVAANHGGVILGVPFDPDAARQVLAYYAVLEGIASTAEQFARRVRDDGLQRYALVVDRAMAAYALMKRSRRTPEGRELQGELKEVALVVKRERPARRPRKSAKEQSSSKPAETPPATPPATSPAQPAATSASSQPHTEVQNAQSASANTIAK